MLASGLLVDASAYSLSCLQKLALLLWELELSILNGELISVLNFVFFDACYSFSASICHDYLLVQESSE